MEIRRFISVDPLADKYPGWNPYHYVHNNPIKLIDPDGMEAETYYENEKTGETVEVKDGIDKTIKVNETDFAKAKEFAENTAGDGETIPIVSEEYEQEYKDFYNSVNSYDELSVENVYDYFFNEPDLQSTDDFKPEGGTIPLVGGPAKGVPIRLFKASPISKLGRYFASLSQMSSEGRVIANTVRDAPRLVAKYGGETKDWVKMSSKTYTGKDGFKFATHWYKNIKTGRIVEYKTKIGG